MPKKKKNLPPRRKRMRRQARLQSAAQWISTYSGKNIIKGYKNWYGVDLICAIDELKMLGVKLDDEYVKQALKSREQLIIGRQNKAKEKQQEFFDSILESNEYFYFTAGYTSDGYP